MSKILRRRYGHMAPPTAARGDGFKADFYSLDCDEPPHVHVRHGDGIAKIWLTPVSLEWARWMKGSTERRALKFVNDNITELLRAWEKHCTKR